MTRKEQGGSEVDLQFVICLSSNILYLDGVLDDVGFGGHEASGYRSCDKERYALYAIAG